MTNGLPDLLADFVNKNTERLKLEAYRLRDNGPLVEHRALFEVFVSIVRKLGTLEHGVALASLSKEYKAATREAVQAWREIWRGFREDRRRAILVEFEFKRDDREFAAWLGEIEVSVNDVARRNRDQSLVALMHDAVGLVKEAHVASRSLSMGWRKAARLLLWVRLRIYFVYLGYFWSRLSIAVMRHAYIIIVAIGIFGLLWAQVVRWMTESAVTVAAWSWSVLALAFGAAVLKKYFVDPRIQRRLVMLEARWLRPIALRVYAVARWPC